MARSRSASFSDDDLEIVGSQAIASQMADMSLNSSPGKDPLKPINANGHGNIIDLSESPVPAATSKPVFGKPTKMDSLLYKKKKEQDKMFNMNRGRPELHLPKHQVVGPSAPRHADVKPPSLQTFSSLPPPPPSTTQRLYPISTFSQPHSSYEDVEIYTDPAKANENLKALLEGGMEDDEEDKLEGDLDADGVLEGIKVKLLPHQVEGVQWMKGRELGPVKRGKVPKGGILADDMGLGKTLQSISLILSNPKPKHDEKGWKKHYDQVEKTTLVVAPLALIRQWEAEIKDKVSKDRRMTVCVHHGPNRTKRFQDLARYDVVVTTYQILVSEHGHSSDSLKAGCFGLHWYRVILDEAHTIKNRNAKATKACYALNTEFRWCLTGTPMQNNLDELQSLVAFLRISPYDNLTSWREHIDGPMKRGKGHIAIRRLHSLLRCFMKRRTKAILKEEGALNPGGKKALEAAKERGEEAKAPAFKVTERKVVTVAAEFSPAERQFYKKLEERADKSLEKMIAGQKVNYANALVLLLRLRQACNHPRLVDSKVEKDQDALGTEDAPKKQAGGDDLDDLTAALGGMNIQAKQCDVCMTDLSKTEVADGQDICSGCLADRAAFEGESPEMKRSRKKKVKRVVSEKLKVELKKKRQPRNRRAVIDSDDEDDGSWLVPEDQQGSLTLGKAGGEEDENAEGGGEWLNSEDSIHHSEGEDGSNLDSFIVDDEKVKAEQASDDSDDDTFLSISKMSSQVQKKPSSSTTDSENGSTEYDTADDSGISESDVDSDDTGRFLYKRKKNVTASTHLQPSAKIRQVVKILHKEAPEHKFIVFSQFTSMLDLMEPFMRKEGFRFTRYDGSMKNDAREAALHSLRTDPRTRILLCSLKCGSLGLNLTAATRVIILEPFWNPFVEEQAIDRVHRLTQTVDVTVYKLTVEKTVEERILELQDKKRQLAEQAIEGGMRKKDAMKLGLKEIMSLFQHDADDDGAEGGSGGGRFGDDRGVRGDVGSMLRNMKTMVKGPSTQRDHNDAFNRRW